MPIINGMEAHILQIIPCTPGYSWKCAISVGPDGHMETIDIVCWALTKDEFGESVHPITVHDFPGTFCNVENTDNFVGIISPSMDEKDMEKECREFHERRKKRP